MLFCSLSPGLAIQRAAPALRLSLGELISSFPV